MSKRIDQVNELIQKEINTIILKLVEFPKEFLVTITRVECDDDLLHGKVYVSVLPESFQKEALGVLIRHAKPVQYMLNRRLAMEHVPQLRYVVDTYEETRADVESLLDQAIKEL